MSSVEEMKRQAAEKAAKLQRERDEQEERTRLHEIKMKKLKQDNAMTKLAEIADKSRTKTLRNRYGTWVTFLRKMQEDAGAYKAVVAWARLWKKTTFTAFRSMLLERQRLEIKELELTQYTPVTTTAHGDGVIERIVRAGGERFPTYEVRTEEGELLTVCLWELEAKENRASSKLTKLNRHLTSGTISLLPGEDGRSAFAEDFRAQMEEAVAELRRDRLEAQKKRVALGEYRLQRAINSFEFGQKQRVMDRWTGILFDYDKWAVKHTDALQDMEDWRQVMRKWTNQKNMVRQRRAQLAALYEKNMASLTQATALSSRMRTEIDEHIRAKKFYQAEAAKYAMRLSAKAEGGITDLWFGDLLAADAEQEIPGVRKSVVQQTSFTWTFTGDRA